jgi:hypothetical protein
MKFDNKMINYFNPKVKPTIITMYCYGNKEKQTSTQNFNTMQSLHTYTLSSQIKIVPCMYFSMEISI